MTKQEQIREGFFNMVREAIEDGHSPDLKAFEIWAYLHSKGVAIVEYPPRGSDLTGCVLVRVKPLIRGNNV